MSVLQDWQAQVLLAGTSALGSLTLVTNNVISVTTDALTSGLGSITAVGHANAYPTGVYGTGEVSTPTVWSQIDPGVTTDWTAITDSQTPDWKEVA